MDYKYNRRYFESIHWLFISFVVIVGLILLYFFLLIGIAILLGVGAFIFYKLYNKPIEADIDIVYDEQAHLIIQKGVERLGLHASDVSLIDPIVIHGPLLDKIRFDPIVIKGKDEEVRSSNHEIIVFYFSEKQMYYYKYSFSVIDDEMNETVGEIFYQDIVSVSTSSITTPYFDHRKRREDFFNLDVFQLTTSGGTLIKCPVKNLQNIEQQIIAMKNILRDKKNVS